MRMATRSFKPALMALLMLCLISIALAQTDSPTVAPTAAPTVAPSTAPTAAPTEAPTLAPSYSFRPSNPTYTPTTKPSRTPSIKPTRVPSNTPKPSTTAAPTEYQYEPWQMLPIPHQFYVDVAMSDSGTFITAIPNNGPVVFVRYNLSTVVVEQDLYGLWISAAMSTSGQRQILLGVSVNQSYPVDCFYSLDYGLTFENVSIGIPGQWTLLSVSSDASTILIAQTMGDDYPLGIYRYDNLLYKPTFSYITSLTWSNLSYDVIQQIEVDQTGTVLAVLCDNRVFYSNDSGISWTQGSTFPTYTQVFLMNTVNSGESMYAVPVGGNDLEVSVNHGNTWTLSPSVININDTTFSTIAGSADTTRMIVGSELGIYLTPDSGTSWTFSTPLSDAFVVSDSQGEFFLAFQKTGTNIYYYQPEYAPTALPTQSPTLAPPSAVVGWYQISSTTTGCGTTAQILSSLRTNTCLLDYTGVQWLQYTCTTDTITQTTYDNDQCLTYSSQSILSTQSWTNGASVLNTTTGNCLSRSCVPSTSSLPVDNAKYGVVESYLTTDCSSSIVKYDAQINNVCVPTTNPVSASTSSTKMVYPMYYEYDSNGICDGTPSSMINLQEGTCIVNPNNYASLTTAMSPAAASTDDDSTFSPTDPTQYQGFATALIDGTTSTSSSSSSKKLSASVIVGIVVGGVAVLFVLIVGGWMLIRQGMCANDNDKAFSEVGAEVTNVVHA